MNTERTSNKLHLLEDLFSREASAVPSNDEEEDMAFGDYTKQRILFYYQQGLKPPKICSLLDEEGIKQADEAH